jgi:prepilin-type N-terminal cleavage/methylation domain-containing protein
VDVPALLRAPAPLNPTRRSRNPMRQNPSLPESATALLRRNAQSRLGGFTLIELLVVIAIIAILAALQTQCVSNQRQIGIARAFILTITRTPCRAFWIGAPSGARMAATISSSRPPTGRFTAIRASRRFFTARQTKVTPVSGIPFCPTRAAGMCSGTATWFNGGGDMSGVRHPFGDLDGAPGTDAAKSMKEAEISLKPVSKIIQGDWIWHPNRGNTDQRSVWHNYRGKSLTVMLWGDSHVAAFTIPPATPIDMPPSLANKWW